MNTVLVTDPGSVWSTVFDFYRSPSLYIGGSGAGNSLVISNGGQVVSDGQVCIGYYSSSSNNTVLVTGTGSVWSNRTSLYVGTTNPGGLVISDGAEVVSYNVYLGSNMNTQTPDFITVDGGKLTATNAVGGGTLVVSSGTLTINDGTVTVDTLRLESGTNAALVYNGGAVKAERAIIANGAVLEFALGSNSQPIEVTGNMVLGAYLNITDAGGFTNGTYTLFTYGGTLTYDGLVMNTEPVTCNDLPIEGEVVTNISHIVDTSTLGQINLNSMLIELARTSEGAVSLRWNSKSNAIYRVEYTDDLSTDAVWDVLHDEYPSQGTNTLWLDTGDYLRNPAIEHPKNVSNRCYRVDYLGTNSVTQPSVTVVFPTNNMTLSGQVTVTVATASSTLPILTSYLYVDGQQMYSSDDGSNFVINTCEWPNGPHTLFATANGQSQLSGPVNSPPVDVAYAASPYAAVTFSNIISQVAFSQQFFEPALGQTQQVTAVFSANVSWTLQIQDESGNTVRNASGSGSSMSFNWDGTGDGESDIDDGVYYYVISAQPSGVSPSSTTAPMRPSTTPGKGSLGTVGVAYWSFSKTNFFSTPYNGVDGPVKIQNFFSVGFPPLRSAPKAANGFVATMAKHRWKVGFNCPGSEFRVNDVRRASLGGNEIFGSVNLGLFLGHGSYGTTSDYNTDASGTMMTYLTSDNPADAGAPWLRLSECGFGGNLRWMGLSVCDMLRDDNFFPMWGAGVLPIPSSLHLLCGASTIHYDSDDFGTLWASKMFRKSPFSAPETVQNAWNDAEEEICTRLTTNAAVICRVVGWDNCFTDTLQNPATGTSYTLEYKDRKVH